MEIAREIIVLQTGEIKPYWRNPRKNDKTVKALIEVIPKVGFNVPIVIDKDNVIIKGHARYKAAVKLKIKELPCVISQNTDELNSFDRLADNKISELAEWNIEELKYEIEQIDFDFSELGFEVEDIKLFEKTEQSKPAAVTNEALEKAEQNLLNPINTNISNYGFNSDEENEENNACGNDVIAERKRSIKTNCPKCGEEIVIYL